MATRRRRHLVLGVVALPAAAAQVPQAEGVPESAPDGSDVHTERATTDVDPATLAEIAALPGMAGAKLSGRSTEELKPYLAAVPDGFGMFSGADREVIDLAAAGCDGIVSGVSSVFPEPFVRTVALLNSGADTSAAQPAIDHAVDALGSGDIHLIKAGVRYRGLPAGAPRVSSDLPAEASFTDRREIVEAGRPIRTD